MREQSISFLGDGLMALFGAPIALEDHAFRAVQASLAILETISGYNIQLHHDHGIEIRLRLGLNTGLGVVGRIGDDLRMDYTAVGNTTHLAARMQFLAQPGTILCTETTYNLVAGYIRSEALGLVEIKGQSEPIAVYKVTGRRRIHSRLEVSAERGLTKLVGRQRERGLLVQHAAGISWTASEEVEFPATMRDIVQARIDRLAETVKRTVQTAAVIGRQFSLSLLSRIVEETVTVEHNLETLKQAELIHETRFFPEVEYRFKHAVIQDAAYQSILIRQRQALHGVIAQILEHLYADQREEQAGILAYHYGRSTYQDKAVLYALLARDQAARLHAYAEATIFYEQALTLAHSLPMSPLAQQSQIDAILKLAAVGWGPPDRIWSGISGILKRPVPSQTPCTTNLD